MTIFDFGKSYLMVEDHGMSSAAEKTRVQNPTVLRLDVTDFDVTIKEIRDRGIENQLEMSFEVDILSNKINYPDQSFDFIVLSHCSWYLESFEQLTSIMEKVKKWGKQLCFAEWDLRVQYPCRLLHWLHDSVNAGNEYLYVCNASLNIDKSPNL